MTALDKATAEDLMRSMALLRGWKSRRNEPWTAELQAIENSYRRCVLLDVVVRTPVAEHVVKVEDQRMTPLWLTTRQASDLAQISEPLIRRGIHEGRLHAVRAGKGFRIRREDFERFIEEQPGANHE